MNINFDWLPMCDAGQIEFIFRKGDNMELNQLQLDDAKPSVSEL